MDQETALLTSAFAENKIELQAALTYSLANPKDSEASEKVRKEGNALFSQKNLCHELLIKVLSLYNKSASLAPNGSQQLATAIANRSAFLLYIGKYEESIQDIQKALRITESNELKVKLLCRQVECLKNLGIVTHEIVLKEAQSLVDIIDDSSENKQMLQKMIKKVSKLVVKKVEIIRGTNEAEILPVTDNVLEKVSIRYNQKYGRHLVAEQNYNPGDIILVEKLFSSSVKYTHHYTACHHCLETCWLGIPCDYCDWALFCSENCSEKAWKEYHHIECSVGQLINQIIDIPWRSCSISLKILIKAMEDAGSIEKLKAQLEAVDQCMDVSSRGFYKDGKFVNNTLESFYSLTKIQLLDSEKKSIPLIALLILIGLLKHSQMMDTCHVKNVEDLINNEDIAFLGSLLIKLTEIEFNNRFPILGNIPKSSRGCCVAPLLSLMNHSCYPNANVRFTKDGKAILYVLQPLEKNSQIFISYAELQYHTIPLKNRKKAIERFNFECDCQACTESWPPILLNCVGKNSIFDDSGDDAFLKETCQGMSALIHKNDHKAALEKLGSIVALAFKNLKQPSALTCGLQITMNECIENIYNVFMIQEIEKYKNSK